MHPKLPEMANLFNVSRPAKFHLNKPTDSLDQVATGSKGPVFLHYLPAPKQLISAPISPITRHNTHLTRFKQWTARAPSDRTRHTPMHRRFPDNARADPASTTWPSLSEHYLASNYSILPAYTGEQAAPGPGMTIDTVTFRAPAASSALEFLEARQVTSLERLEKQYHEIAAIKVFSGSLAGELKEACRESRDLKKQIKNISDAHTGALGTIHEKIEGQRAMVENVGRQFSQIQEFLQKKPKDAFKLENRVLKMEARIMLFGAQNAMLEGRNEELQRKNGELEGRLRVEEAERTKLADAMERGFQFLVGKLKGLEERDETDGLEGREKDEMVEEEKVSWDSEEDAEPKLEPRLDDRSVDPEPSKPDCGSQAFANDAADSDQTDREPPSETFVADDPAPRSKAWGSDLDFSEGEKEQLFEDLMSPEGLIEGNRKRPPDIDEHVDGDEAKKPRIED